MIEMLNLTFPLEVGVCIQGIVNEFIHQRNRNFFKGGCTCQVHNGDKKRMFVYLYYQIPPIYAKQHISNILT